MIFSGCLVGATYNHTADIYKKTLVQDPTSYAVADSWAKDHSITCYARSIQTDAVSDAASGKKVNDIYAEYEFIKIMTGEKLNRRQRITNIRGSNGVLLWSEYERGEAVTVFEVQGVTSISDPFGAVIEYEVLAKRVQVQNG
jgi:hypothetical protein